jgi:hypothetical protein
MMISLIFLGVIVLVALVIVAVIAGVREDIKKDKENKNN